VPVQPEMLGQSPGLDQGGGRCGRFGNAHSRTSTNSP
jgi:hypothetical protein